MEAALQLNRRDALIEEYQEYVHYVVGYLIQSMGLPVQFFEEFVSAGYLGLVEAAERFDFESGHPFKNFAFLRIRGAIIDSIRECSELSGKAYRYARALRAADELRQTLVGDGGEQHRDGGREASLSTLLDYAAKSVMAFRLTLGECENKISTRDAYGEDPETLLGQKQHARIFRSMVATLPAKERLVIEEYYFHDKSFAEIAAQHAGLSKSWVSRLHSRALQHLQEKYFSACSEPAPADVPAAVRVPRAARA